MPRKNVTPRYPPRYAGKRARRHAPVQVGQLTRMKIYREDSYEAALARTELRRAKTGEYMPAAVIKELHRMWKDEAKRK
jgi:hypothetical protein